MRYNYDYIYIKEMPMRQKFLTARNVVAALAVMLVSLCFVIGISAFSTAYVFAAEEDNVADEITQTEFNTKDFKLELAKGVNLTYTGEEVKPDVVVKYGDITLAEGVDYTLSYENNVNATEEGATVIVTGTGDYSGTLTLKFIIAKQNAWVVYPSAVGWKYGEYDAEATYLMAEPLYGVENMTLMVCNEDSNFIDFGEGLGAQFTLEDGKLPKQVSDKLATLDAGTYYFKANVGATASYTGLDIIGNAKGVKFVVSRATNTWLTTPTIVQWAYGSFNKSINIMKAIPQYPLTGNKTVTFGIYTDASCYADSAVEGLKEIEVKHSTASGVQLSPEQTDVFGKLSAGTYYINAVVAVSTNYTGLSTAVQFEVLPAQNRWKETPQIVQWTYGGYRKDINLLKAVPQFGEQEDVVFGIFTDKSYGQSADGLGEFSLIKVVETNRDEEGNFIGNTVKFVLPEGIEDKLSALGAGEYFLRAELAGKAGANGKDNYSSMSTVVPFRIQQAQNHWKTTPSVLGWEYGQFDKKVNAINAEAALGEAEIEIYHTDGTPVVYSDNGTIVSSFKLVEENGKLTVPEYIAASLKGLNVGTYYMLASVKGANDYSGLNEYISI